MCRVWWQHAHGWNPLGISGWRANIVGANFQANTHSHIYIYIICTRGPLKLNFMGYTHNYIHNGYTCTVISFFFVLKYFRQAKKCRNFCIKNLTWRKIRKHGRWPTTSISFVLFTFHCLHLFVYMLASNRNMNFVHEISRVKYTASRKFSGQNIFGIKRNDKNFSHKLFGIQINTNENKAKYGTI